MMVYRTQRTIRRSEVDDFNLSVELIYRIKCCRVASVQCGEYLEIVVKH